MYAENLILEANITGENPVITLRGTPANKEIIICAHQFSSGEGAIHIEVEAFFLVPVDVVL